VYQALSIKKIERERKERRKNELEKQRAGIQ